MAADREPPGNAGRSIYERLGLSPALGTLPRRPPRIVPGMSGMPRRSGSRLLPFILFALAVALGVYLFLSTPDRTHPVPTTPADDDQRRMDMQQAEIRQLDQRIDMLEVRLKAMQALADDAAIRNGAAAKP